MVVVLSVVLVVGFLLLFSGARGWRGWRGVRGVVGVDGGGGEGGA